MFLALMLTVLVYNGVECALSSGSVSAGDCVCTTTTVNGHSAAGLSASVVASVTPGTCGKIYGGILTKDGYTWFEITYNGQRIWVAGDYFDKSSSSSCSDVTNHQRGHPSTWPVDNGSDDCDNPSASASTGSTAGCPSIVSRSAWGARAPRSTSYMPIPASYAFIHHAESNECFDQSSCASLVRGFQNYHMDSNGWADIGYSFLIGGDGSVFEGRGWDHLGAHTGGHNSEGFGFCFIGSFTSKKPTDIQIAKAKQIIDCGVSKGKIKSSYTVRGHRDMMSTDCPGDVLYGLIRTWPHY